MVSALSIADLGGLELHECLRDDIGGQLRPNPLGQVCPSTSEVLLNEDFHHDNGYVAFIAPSRDCEMRSCDQPAVVSCAGNNQEGSRWQDAPDSTGPLG